MIIVEGPDGAGKTTLINDIRQWFHWPIAPRVVSKDAEAMVDLKDWVELNLAKGFHRSIYDRHRLVSEPIYGAVLRNEFEPGFDNLGWLSEMMWSFYEKCNPIIIYCLPPWKEVEANTRVGIEYQPQHVVDNIRKIYSLYLSQASREYHSRERTFVYDYTRPQSYPDLLRSINLVLKEEKHV